VTGSATATPTPQVGLVLDNNFFNPTQNSLGMDVRVYQAGQIKIMVFNMIGEEVDKIWDQYTNVGEYRAQWDGRNTSGSIVGNAVYFLVISQPSGHTIQKVIVLK
jgi:hypothetical protein